MDAGSPQGDRTAYIRPCAWHRCRAPILGGGGFLLSVVDLPLWVLWLSLWSGETPSRRWRYAVASGSCQTQAGGVTLVFPRCWLSHATWYVTSTWVHGP